MFTRLLLQVFKLLFSPSEWIELRKKPLQKELFLTQLLYPLIGITSLSVVLGQLFAAHFDIEVTLKMVTVVAVKYFLGYHLSLFVTHEFLMSWTKVSRSEDTIEQFIGYIMCIMMAINTGVNFLPHNTLTQLIPLYVLLPIWSGVARYLQLEMKRRDSLYLYAAISCVMLGSIALIGKMIQLFMPGI